MPREKSRTVDTTPFVAARENVTQQFKMCYYCVTLQDFKFLMTRAMTGPCDANGPVGKHVKFRSSSRVSKCGVAMGK